MSKNLILIFFLSISLFCIEKDGINNKIDTDQDKLIKNQFIDFKKELWSVSELSTQKYHKV